VTRELTVSVRGTLGLDDGAHLLDALESSTGLEWRLAPAPDRGHLSGGIAEVVLVAVLSKSTELAYGAVVEKVRDRVEQWRRGRLDRPEYELGEQSVAAEAPEAAEAGTTDTEAVTTTTAAVVGAAADAAAGESPAADQGEEPREHGTAG